MIIRRKRRKVPGLNTASIADISFTLLILFLVVTSMDEEKGLTRLLPQMTQQKQSTEIADRNLMRLRIDGQNQIFIDDELVKPDEIRQQVMTFVDNPQNLASLPEKREMNIYGFGKRGVTDAHVIQVDADRNADFNTYFMVQNEIVAAYDQLRDKLAMARFHRHYDECPEEIRKSLRECYPQRVSETYNMKEGGEQ
ncbi:MAG: biopolymer transporter ExbD [Prevotella sp.]|nr:biopolymer transporter ExbD [Prevotella sp.]